MPGGFTSHTLAAFRLPAQVPLVQSLAALFSEVGVLFCPFDSTAGGCTEFHTARQLIPIYLYV